MRYRALVGYGRTDEQYTLYFRFVESAEPNRERLMSRFSEQEWFKIAGRHFINRVLYKSFQRNPAGGDILP